MSSPVKRLSRAEQQQQTRQRLIAVALELYVERGIDATSIEDVVAGAGFTRGAFYSNFASKHELVLETAAEFLRLLHGAALPEGHDVPPDVGDAYRERTQRLQGVAAGGASVFLAELALYGIRNPEVRDAIGELHREQLKRAVAFVRMQFDSAGVKKPSNVTYETLANIVQSLTFGLDLFGRINPDITPQQAVAVATRALIKGL